MGFVVNGGARDVAGFREMGFPLFCTRAEARLEKFQITGVNVPVEVGRVTIRPGDIIVADEDGVVSIPASVLPMVLNKRKTIFEVERGMEDALNRDVPVPETIAILAKKKPKP